MIYQGIQGWFDFEDFYDWIINQYKQESKKVLFVEIGVWKGRSTAYMAERLMQYSCDNIMFFAADTFKGSPNEALHKRDPEIGRLFEVASKNLEPVHDYVHLVQKDSISFSKYFVDNSISFVFIDGTHTYDAVKADIEHWLPKLKEGGIIAGHDYDWKEVARAVDTLLPEKKLFKNNIWYFKK